MVRSGCFWEVDAASGGPSSRKSVPASCPAALAGTGTEKQTDAASSSDVSNRRKYICAAGYRNKGIQEYS